MGLDLLLAGFIGGGRFNNKNILRSINTCSSLSSALNNDDFCKPSTILIPYHLGSHGRNNDSHLPIQFMRSTTSDVENNAVEMLGKY